MVLRGPQTKIRVILHADLLTSRRPPAKKIRHHKIRFHLTLTIHPPLLHSPHPSSPRPPPSGRRREGRGCGGYSVSSGEGSAPLPSLPTSHIWPEKGSDSGGGHCRRWQRRRSPLPSLSSSSRFGWKRGVTAAAEAVWSPPSLPPRSDRTRGATAAAATAHGWGGHCPLPSLLDPTGGERAAVVAIASDGGCVAHLSPPSPSPYQIWLEWGGWRQVGLVAGDIFFLFIENVLVGGWL